MLWLLAEGEFGIPVEMMIAKETVASTRNVCRQISYGMRRQDTVTGQVVKDSEGRIIRVAQDIKIGDDNISWVNVTQTPDGTTTMELNITFSSDLPDNLLDPDAWENIEPDSASFTVSNGTDTFQLNFDGEDMDVTLNGQDIEIAEDWKPSEDLAEDILDGQATIDVPVIIDGEEQTLSVTFELVDSSGNVIDASNPDIDLLNEGVYLNIEVQGEALNAPIKTTNDFSDLLLGLISG